MKRTTPTKDTAPVAASIAVRSRATYLRARNPSATDAPAVLRNSHGPLTRLSTSHFLSLDGQELRVTNLSLPKRSRQPQIPWRPLLALVWLLQLHGTF
jgi:hypothetical protein